MAAAAKKWLQMGAGWHGAKSKEKEKRGRSG